MRSSFERASETSSLDPRVPNCLRVSYILSRINPACKALVAPHKTAALKARAKLKQILHDPTPTRPRLAGRSGARSRRVRPVPPRRGPCGPRPRRAYRQPLALRRLHQPPGGIEPGNHLFPRRLAAVIPSGRLREPILQAPGPLFLLRDARARPVETRMGAG